MKHIYKINIFLLLFPFLFYGQLTNKVVKASIKTDDNTDYISITSFAENLTDSYKSLYFKLTVIKNDKDNNSSNNTQSGRFTMEANQLKTLSKTQINLVKDNQIIILLLIYDENNKLLGKDRVVLGEKKTETSNKKKLKDGIEISGIISDETKTKMGKDFYDVFMLGCVEAALAASIFHFKEVEIPTLKNYLKEKNIHVRV